MEQAISRHWPVKQIISRHTHTKTNKHVFLVILENTAVYFLCTVQVNTAEVEGMIVISIQYMFYPPKTTTTTTTTTQQQTNKQKQQQNSCLLPL